MPWIKRMLLPGTSAHADLDHANDAHHHILAGVSLVRRVITDWKFDKSMAQPGTGAAAKAAAAAAALAAKGKGAGKGGKGKQGKKGKDKWGKRGKGQPGRGKLRRP